jgi:thymidylate synthase
MNKLDLDYQALLQDILDNGVEKQDRTGTGTLSVFGRTVRHDMKTGFPALTTKKLYFRGVVTELLWFLRGDTNIKFLVDNACHIWDGDAYKNFVKTYTDEAGDIILPPDDYINDDGELLSQEEFINKIKTDDEFAKKWGELGPIYGKQWRDWGPMMRDIIPLETGGYIYKGPIDQIANLINDLKTNPDSRRLMVSAWAVHDLPNMVLPPCHYGFQVYTRELSLEERCNLANFAPFDDRFPDGDGFEWDEHTINIAEDWLKQHHPNLPTRAISLMWNQRSVDVLLGLPFNIASYGLLLEIIAKTVNMIPDQLIGNLGDTHLYLNHLDQAQEQIGKDYTPEERHELLKQAMGDFYQTAVEEQVPFGGGLSEYYEAHKIPRRSREPYPLPKLNINTEWWPTEGGEPGAGPIDAQAVFRSFSDINFCKCLMEEDIQLANYKSHPAIKAPLSN